MDSEALQADGYRRADLVELHDAGVVIYTREFSASGSGWREYTELGESIVIEGEEIARLAQHLGLEPRTIFEEDLPGGRSMRLQLRDAEFAFHRRRVAVGGGGTGIRHEDGRFVDAIGARIEGPRQLTLRVRFCWKIGDGWEGEEREVVYHGPFTVWWHADGLSAGDGR